MLVASGVDQGEQDAIISRFNAEPDHDHAEIVEQCQALLEELHREGARRRFTSAALEDTESNLDRLRRWLDRVRDRDFFHAPRSAQAKAALAGCERAYEAQTCLVTRDASTRR